MIVFDKYMLYDRDLNVYVVVGNKHPPGGVIAYRKYTLANSRETIWFNRLGEAYKRIVKNYYPSEIHSSTTRRIYCPDYDSELPYIGINEIKLVLNPLDRLREVTLKPRDPLESIAGEIASIIRREANIPFECLGITGSILAKIHNVKYSDLDYVVYNSICSYKVIEVFQNNALECITGFKGEELIKWSKRISKKYHIPVDKAVKLYRSWRRGVTCYNRQYSIAYTSNNLERFGEEKWITEGVIKVKALVNPSHKSIGFPSRAVIDRYHVLEKRAKLEHKVLIKEVISFDNVFLPMLLEEGYRIIEGLLQYSDTLGYYRIVVGGIEHPGYIIPKE